ncbi:hypothetical protein J7K24_01850 [bacterium]|nr:hypothetical protein [bacterium]
MWLVIAIIAYFFLGLANFLDKYILGGAILSPKTYCFFAGITSVLVLLIVPLVVLVSFLPSNFLAGFLPELSDILFIPDIQLILLSFSAGWSFLLSLFIYYKGVSEFEVSRIAPAVGAGVPLFTFFLIYILNLFYPNSLFNYELSGHMYLALLFLIGGNLTLTVSRDKLATFESLGVSTAAAFCFSFSFLLTKIIYLSLSFWCGFVWINIGTFLGALVLLIIPEVRRAIKKPEKRFFREKVLPFMIAKASGALGGLLQNAAIFLAPLAFLPLVNAMAGIQYIFLIILATLLFFKFPDILQEEVSKKVIIQKTIAVWLIVGGLFLLSIS